MTGRTCSTRPSTTFIIRSAAVPLAAKQCLLSTSCQKLYRSFSYTAAVQLRLYLIARYRAALSVKLRRSIARLEQPSRSGTPLTPSAASASACFCSSFLSCDLVHGRMLTVRLHFLQSITAQGLHYAGDETPADLDYAKRQIWWWSGGLCILLVFVWPLLALPAGVFSKVGLHHALAWFHNQHGTFVAHASATQASHMVVLPMHTDM